MAHPLSKISTLGIMFCLALNAYAQDIPLFNQKITNSFLYNPAQTGFQTASIKFVYKQTFNNVQGAPQTNVLSGETPFRNSRFGVGLLIYQDEVNFIRNNLVMVSFAYHMKIRNDTYLSMGLSGEADRLGVVTGTNFAQPTPNPIYDALAQQSATDVDFSFGLHLHTPLINTGFSINRLSSSLNEYRLDNYITNFYSVYASMALLPGSEIFRIEPFVAYRALSSSGKFGDLGVYLTLKDKFTLGLTGRTTGNVGVVIGFNVNSRFSMAYSPEQSIGNQTRELGQTHEVDLIYTFEEPAAKQTAGRQLSLDYEGYPLENSRGGAPSSVRKRQKENFNGYKKMNRGRSTYRKRKHQGKRY